MLSSRIIKWLIILLIAWQWSDGYRTGFFQFGGMGKNAVIDPYGAMVRVDTSQKEIYLVFTAHSYNDGGNTIRNTLREKDVKASFFFTGDFYRAAKNEKLIESLIADGHYLGAHSDRHLLYADWGNRDSTLVTRAEFKKDLEGNYRAMETFGIEKKDALYYLPSYEWYNNETSDWTKDFGLQLVNYSPGTGTARDYTWPEMGERYSDNKEIIEDLGKIELNEGLNGALILIHLGTDPRREEKLYASLNDIMIILHNRGYQFKRLL